ncbi:MAG: ParB N-terminal domain-containing protein [Chloroflexales bacterium]
MPPKPKRERPSLNLNQFFEPPSGGDDLDFLLGAPEETAQRAQARGLPLRDIPVYAIAPDADQVRHLPHPANLLQMEAAGDQAASAILAALRDLGESLRENGQVQPAIAYPDSDPQNPAITHRLLHGQRRWSAAVLAGLPTLWTVVVERPSDVSRLLRQFEENERRAGLVDMERAWALMSLRDAIQRETNDPVPWAVVEARLQISEGRRHDLLRLLRFPPEGQAIILRYGWAEWTLRTLHQALAAGMLDAATTTELLRSLAGQPDVTAPAVSMLVANAIHARHPPVLGGAGAAPGAEPAAAADAHGSPDTVSQRLARLRQGVERIQAQVTHEKSPERRAAWRAEATLLQASLEALLATLQRG